MTVWVEGVDDHGSAVWGCEHCRHGGWCPNRVDALAEAERHARAHGIQHVAVVDRRHGPKPIATRDEKIRTMLAKGITIRAIAIAVGLSTAGVIKAKRRIEKGVRSTNTLTRTEGKGVRPADAHSGVSQADGIR